jgi:signal transduction histidine kinase
VELTLVDDGRGLPEPMIEGVGVAGMRERAAELGGSLSIGPRHDGPGVAVRLLLPTGARQ